MQSGNGEGEGGGEAPQGAAQVACDFRLRIVHNGYDKTLYDQVSLTFQVTPILPYSRDQERIEILLSKSTLSKIKATSAAKVSLDRHQGMA